METPRYIHLKPGDAPPKFETSGYFKVVVVIEDDVSAEWRAEISDWLVRNGCRYMMAWGKECSAWDDSVDWASLEASDFDDVPDEAFMMTTWHEGEPLKDVFWFSDRSAMHPGLELPQTYILHISPEAREKELLELFRQAILE